MRLTSLRRSSTAVAAASAPSLPARFAREMHERSAAPRSQPFFPCRLIAGCRTHRNHVRVSISTESGPDATQLRGLPNNGERGDETGRVVAPSPPRMPSMSAVVASAPLRSAGSTAHCPDPEAPVESAAALIAAA